MKVNRLLVKQCLNGHGYQFLEATNGREALEKLHSTPVDLIILDLMMPVLDGFAVLQHLKTDGHCASIPVIVNSSLDDQGSIQKALEMGSYDYFIKTLPREQLEFILPLKAKNAIHTKRLLDEIEARKTLLERELHAAGRYQRFLLPKDYNVPGLEIATLFHPQLGVGGDFFDFVPLTQDKLALVIADVSGHGVLSAMVTAIFKPLFAQYMQETESLLTTLRRMNQDFLTLTEESHFVTVFAAIYDPRQHVLHYANAGHPPPLYEHASTGVLEALKATGLFLGLFDTDWMVEERTLAVDPHDRLLLITDGVSEAMSTTGTYFGTDALPQLMRDTAHTTLHHTVQELWSRLQDFTNAQLHDDITALALRFQAQPTVQELSMANDPGQIQSVVNIVLHTIGEAASPQEREAIRISLGEILMNAIEHGNLAIGSAQKHAHLEAGTFDDLVEVRRRIEPYASRRVQIQYVIDPMKVTITVTDAGAGFAWRHIPDPRLDTNVGLAHGRGVLIARSNMDECTFHPPGNRVTLVKHFSPQPSYAGVLQAL
jgi:serine phosphatase RsbU (regulator of sigma subunit)/anti-sigma regulatory factor (Ser/Thr protein kinase)